MKLTFTKRPAKFDDLLIERDGRPPERIACPKQGIIPHDMVHLAVERIVAQNGFLARVARGEAATPGMTREADTEAIERLVETMQAEAWSSRDPAFRSGAAEELIALYETSCAARFHPCLRITPADVDLIRREIDSLTERWEAVPMNGSLTLTLDGAAEAQSA